MFQSTENPRRYVAVLMAIILFWAAGSFIYRTHDFWARGLGHLLSTCDPEGTDESNYIATCTAPLFGDYEHGALYFGLEKEAIEHLRKADVLVLGNSKAMFAFSTRATAQAFRELDARFYLLGFGYREYSRFPLALIRKYRLRPKAVIINADPFFVDSSQFQDVIDGNPGTYFLYVLQKYFQRTQATLCPKPLEKSFLCGKNRTIYRSIADGRWQLQNYVSTLDPRQIPETWENTPTPDLASQREVARKFRSHLAVPDPCVIITLTPSPSPTGFFAETIAHELNATYVVPSLNGYHTIDDVHLAPEDAERWSAEILGRAKDTLRECLLKPTLAKQAEERKLRYSDENPPLDSN